MFEIDEKAVSDAVSINQAPKASSFPPPPPPKPLKQVESPLEVAVSPPVVASPPTLSSSPASSDSGDFLLVAIAGGVFAAFAAGTFLMRGRGDEEESQTSAPAPVISPAPSPAASALTSSDVSIPYDAAARLAYDEWRAANDKGAFSEPKFEKFKAHYEVITSANMAAKKKARNEGTNPQLQTLSVSADE